VGDKTLDLSEVDLSSLKFSGARALSTSTRDIDGDGIPDLLLTFDMSQLKLSPRATVGRLSGWLKNSQAFFGENKIRVVPSLGTEDASCR
jgi:hypothetical protein